MSTDTPLTAPASGAGTVVLELRDVGMTYPGDPPVHALRHVDLRVRAGEFVAVVGPSGSGKSTLLHVMGSLDRPTGGAVYLDGLDLTALSDTEIAAVRARRIGFVFQQFFLDEHFSALDNVADGLLYAGVPAAERRRRAAEALGRVGLADRATFLPSHLSGGQRQRVAIARALVGRPSVVLADEPTGNLDSASGAAILDLLEELHRQGTTILVITHDRDLAARIPRRVEVRDGRIVFDSAASAAPSGAAAVSVGGGGSAATPDMAAATAAVDTPDTGTPAVAADLTTTGMAHRAVEGMAGTVGASAEGMPATGPGQGRSETGGAASAPSSDSVPRAQIRSRRGQRRGGAALRPAPPLRLPDLLRLAAAGIRARWQRAALSALGIAVGVAAVVAVLGLSASSQAGLLAEIDRLGTNLLTAANGTNFFGQATELPLAAPAMVQRLPHVLAVADTGTSLVPGMPTVNAYRNPLVPSGETGGLTVRATTLDLPSVVGTTVAQGSFLNPATATLPVAVIGSQAAVQLGIDQVLPGERLWIGGQWFYLAGILAPAPLATEIDSSVLVGFPAAETYLGFDGHPSTLYVRAQNDAVAAVDALLGPQSDPEDPSGISVSQPSKALVARAQAKSAFTGLFVGLAAVALLVGAIGVANIMVISVLERRREIGLRRALGATRGHVRVQFLSEAMLLAGLGGAAGIGFGVVATAVYALTKHWLIVVPPLAWAGGFGAALAIGAVSGLVPAQRAAALAPTEALRTVA